MQLFVEHYKLDYLRKNQGFVNLLNVACYYLLNLFYLDVCRQSLEFVLLFIFVYCIVFPSASFVHSLSFCLLRITWRAESNNWSRGTSHCFSTLRFHPPLPGQTLVSNTYREQL